MGHQEGVARSGGGAWRVGVVFLVIAVTQTGAFNVDVGSSVVHRGPSQSCTDGGCMFGFSVAQHKEGGNPWILVGAPTADAGQPGVFKGGAVYKCSTMQPGNCQIIPFDRTGNNLVAPGGHLETKLGSAGQGFGSEHGPFEGAGDRGSISSEREEGEVNNNSVDGGSYGSEASYSGGASEDIVVTHGGKWIWSEENNKWEWEAMASASSTEASGVVEMADVGSTESTWLLLPNGTYTRRSSFLSNWSPSSSSSGGWIWSEENKKWDWDWGEMDSASSNEASGVVETADVGSTESPWILLDNGTYTRRSSSWSSWSSSSSSSGGDSAQVILADSGWVLLANGTYVRRFSSSSSSGRKKRSVSGHEQGNKGRNDTGVEQFDSKSRQWFGSLVRSSGEDGTVLACAPRYVWFSRSFQRREPVGTCFLARDNFRNFLEYSPCRTRKWGYHRQGSCQAGIGAAIAQDGDQVFIGAVGSWYWQGQVFSKNLQHQLHNQTETKEGPAEDDNSYLGYSLTTGKFRSDGDGNDVAVGMPRGKNLMGKVVLYDSNLNNLNNMTGDQLGAYFGYSLAACDVNGDGLDDIIIGAPMWTDYSITDKFEIGRVYVVYQNQQNKFRNWDTLTGKNHKARFGLSIASLGNINMDGITDTRYRGFEDFVVGAPYDGPEQRGAVHIYLGSPDGIKDGEPSQVIYASDFGFGMRAFGFSVDGGMDLDNNHYPDLLVGAYESGHAVHMKAAPVIHVNASIRFENPNENPQCPFTDIPFIPFTDGVTSAPCVTQTKRDGTIDVRYGMKVTVTLSYGGIGVPNKIDLDLKYILDAKKRRRHKRLFFLNNKSTRTANVELFKNREWETRFTVYLPMDLKDKETSIDLQLIYTRSSSNYRSGRGVQLNAVVDSRNNMAMDSFHLAKDATTLPPASRGRRSSQQFSYRQDRDQDSGLLLQNPCVSKQTCSECLQTPSCAWCMQPDYLSNDKSALPRCNQEEFFYRSLSSRGKCDNHYIMNPNNQFTILQNVELRRKSNYMDAVQIEPQHVQLSLRVNEPFNMDFYYEKAIDHPIDLYYLMDFSKSMEDDQEKLSGLGDMLAETMKNITTDFQLGFGSFVDKVVMPYVSTVPRKLDEPCDGCTAPYGYKHHMQLGKDTSIFAGVVKKAQISGNLDAPEGGFDAIMQAIVCADQIGWRNNARKLLVFSTDAGFHIAGDGKLGGIITPNDGKCHMDSKGIYTHSSIQDYPSVAQINNKVKENSINLIFAVTEEQIDVYNELAGSVEGSSAGILASDSSNVVSLLQAQYEAITDSIEMKDNATGNVRVTYFSSCLGDGPMRQTNKCSGLKVGNRVTFTAKIEVVKCPKDPREWKQLFNIYPEGIDEGVLVDLEMICQCDCEKPGNFGYEENSPQCNVKGTLKCGICECRPDSFGENCQCDADNLAFGADLEAGCRPDNTTTLCNNRGDCICGKCECYPRENQYEQVSGDFCECDNFSCDRHNGLLCSGPDHGECMCGKCYCNPEWDVDGYSACECRASEETCITPYGEHINKVCSDHGTCQCGECLCEETPDGQYSGQYCEECPTCPGKCSELKTCVECMQFKTGEYMDGVDDVDEDGVHKCDKCPFLPMEVDVIDEYDGDRFCADNFDDNDCRFKFAYGYRREGELQVWVQKTKECPLL